MSADLFAEFNDLSSPPPPPQQQQQQRQQRPSGASSQVLNSAPQDPFGFLQSSSTPPQPSQQPPQPWGGFQSQSGPEGAWGQSSSPAYFSSNTPQVGDDDDGWGDFEVAEPERSKPSVSSADSWQGMTSPPPPVAPEYPGKTRLVRAPTLDIMGNHLLDLGDSPKVAYNPSRAQPEPPKPKPKASSRPKLKQPTDPTVLFDAQDFELEGGEEDDDDDDFDGDDDFGDFEAVAPPHPKPAPVPVPARKQPMPPPSMDLLSLDEPPPPEPARSPVQKSEAKRTHKPSGSLSFGATAIPKSQGPPTSASKTPRPTTKTNTSKGAEAEDDDWAAWDDFEPAPTKKETVKPATSQDAGSWDWDAVDTANPSQPSRPEVSDDQPPPVNVPPPSVLLSAFPALFNTGNALFKPVSGQNASIKQRILSDPKAVDFLNSYILIATTAARVIAGRKHRWHRDKILAKSMSISAAGSKGMKLAGVDKTQSVREDREAADVAAAWREHVGRLRSAVAAANSAGKASLKVPEISENIPVQTAKFAPTAPKPCVICGLKRDERVTKVDFDVEDSFGEWWAEHWGHRACKNFWLQHEETLRQR
ncbi:hypothetical protein ACO1O0_000800 [Amphichorda felina]